MPLREGPFAFMDLLDATVDGGIRFRISRDVVRYGCFACDATFEQTAAGHRALREHEGEHGRGMVADLSELDGRTLRIVTWMATSKDSVFNTPRPEIWGVDDERGVVYYLSNSYQGDTVWKWRLNPARSGALAALSAATHSDQASPLTVSAD
jgi:hypothetical protein